MLSMRKRLCFTEKDPGHFLELRQPIRLPPSPRASTLCPSLGVFDFLMVSCCYSCCSGDFRILCMIMSALGLEGLAGIVKTGKVLSLHTVKGLREDTAPSVGC